LHRVLNWDPGDTFRLVDPGVSRQRGHVFLLRRVQLLSPRLRAFFLVGISTRRGADDNQGEQAEEGKKKHDSDPRRERGTRLIILEWFFLSHVSSQY
jgi:hypothetical protein